MVWIKILFGCFICILLNKGNSYNQCARTDDKETGYILEVDLEYPESLHDMYKDYPLALDASGLLLKEIKIPHHSVRDHSATLECYFDLEGEKLYSVKWYKDGNEFFRFVPEEKPPAQLFPLPGVSVDIHNSSETQVVLKSVNLSSSGRYRCEVSAEAPSFQTVSDHSEMIVVALPETGPRIYGGRPRYQIGDHVRVNCTSGRSKPAAQLMWFINGNQADRSSLRGPWIKETGREYLETTTLGLEFKVKPTHFKRGDMKLKCLATISDVYWNSNEESVEGDKPEKVPVLESRVTEPPHTKSRADRVHEKNGSDGTSFAHVGSSILVSSSYGGEPGLSSAPGTNVSVSSVEFTSSLENPESSANLPLSSKIRKPTSTSIISSLQSMMPSMPSANVQILWTMATRALYRLMDFMIQRMYGVMWCAVSTAVNIGLQASALPFYPAMFYWVSALFSRASSSDTC